METVRPKKIPLDTASFLIWMIGELLGKTWTFSQTGRSDLDMRNDAGKGRIYCFWHSNLLSFSYLFRNTGKSAVISESTDGRRAAAVAQRWGHGVIAGSSTRGGSSALRASVRALRQGINVGITPDGPRGPLEIVKPGVAQIAMLAGALVVPVTALASEAWRLKSWDRFFIPKPYAHIDIRLRDPLDPQQFAGEQDPESSFLAAIQKAMAQ